MNRRQLFGGIVMAGASSAIAGQGRRALVLSEYASAAAPALAAAPSPIRVTGFKRCGMTWEDDFDGPYVFVKLEAGQGVVLCGEATREGRVGAVLQTMIDLKEFYLGQAPMPVEHIWESM